MSSRNSRSDTGALAVVLPTCCARKRPKYPAARSPTPLGILRKAHRVRASFSATSESSWDYYWLTFPGQPSNRHRQYPSFTVIGIASPPPSSGSPILVIRPCSQAHSARFFVTRTHLSRISASGNFPPVNITEHVAVFKKQILSVFWF